MTYQYFIVLFIVRINDNFDQLNGFLMNNFDLEFSLIWNVV